MKEVITQTRKDLEKTIDIQHEYIEELLWRIDNIATLIWDQAPLKAQDLWLYDICNEGIWEAPDGSWDRF